ncbi:phosphatidate cytidylyltransferase [bacterium]|nr:phosphatidate cytidylyltransferase [bacterium]MBU1753050.1 phosphatidate cytidylyltransferase [bacterium]
MRVRLVPALLFIPFLIYSIFSKYSLFFSLIIAGVIIIGLIEIISLISRSGAKPFKILCFVLAIPLIIISYIQPSWYHLFSGCFLILFWLLFICGLLSRNEFLKRFGPTLAAVIYVAYLLSHLILIRHLPNSSSMIFFLFMVVWLTDTGAYVFGTRFGKHKLMPQISPNKSVEGAIAGCISGMIAGVVVNIILNYMGLYQIPAVHIIFLSFALSIISQISDLIESSIKRAAGVKDSGNWIPGHGGLLDVFDSVILTTPFLYYWMLWQ